MDAIDEDDDNKDEDLSGSVNRYCGQTVEQWSAWQCQAERIHLRSGVDCTAYSDYRASQSGNPALDLDTDVDTLLPESKETAGV